MTPSQEYSEIMASAAHTSATARRAWADNYEPNDARKATTARRMEELRNNRIIFRGDSRILIPGPSCNTGSKS